ncbi:MAG: adenylate/guanylate cyclase domain-containing protein [Hyphomicrobiales bacterium]
MNQTVKHWLDGIGLGDHLQIFVDNEIDLDAARDLTEEDLRELGFAMGLRKKLLRAIAKLNNSHVDNSAVALPEVSATSEPKGVPAGERRQVTVLFADITGFTRLSSEIDAEVIHALLTHYFEAVDGIVESFGGRVDKHIGDTVMAVFGAPISHGNDPERAVRAAAAIHQVMPAISRAVGHEIRVHIGIASGQVVASGVGENESYTVTGESVNLASRLTDKAGATETLISERVMQTLREQCRANDIGELVLKGIEKPIRAFRVLEIASKESSNDTRPLVGRQVEVQQLKAVLDTTEQTNGGHIVYLRGEPGIGKTRLTEELHRIASLKGFDCYRALILDFGAGKGQDAIRFLTRSLLSARPAAAEEELRVIVDHAVAQGLIGRDQIAFLNDLLDLAQPHELRSLYSAMDNTRRNQGKGETIASIVRRISQSTKLLLIFEDVHWADNIVLQHLGTIARSIEDHPVVLAMTSRLEGDQMSAAWRATTGSTPIVTVDLRPLRPVDAMALASEFFDANDTFARSCVERAGGNPLFLEQLLRGAEVAADEAIPESIQSMVQARVDALEPADKSAIQAAAILGQRFSLEALRHVSGEVTYDCRRLIDRHLVRPDGDALLFAHALVRDGVYSSLLKPRQAKLHEKAAQWYRDQDTALCAQHLDRAGHPSAANAYLVAANNQADVLRYESSIAFCRRGLELAVQASEISNLNCALGEALLNTKATEAAIEVFKSAVAHAPDDPAKAKALIGLAAALRIADRQALAFAPLDEAQRLATQRGLEADLAHIHYLRGNLCFPLGRIDECMAEHESALRLAEKIQSPLAQARAFSGLADAHYLRGHMKTACERFRACVDLCRQHGFGQLEVANRHMIGWTRIHLMEFREALRDALDVQAMAAEIRHSRALMFGKTLAGIIKLEFGDLDGAGADLGESASIAASMSSNSSLSQSLRSLALVRHRQGRSDEARACAEQALSVSRTAGMTFIGPAVLATCAAVSDDDDERRQFLEEAERILDKGCVAHNQIWFAQVAIDDAVSKGEWQSVRRYADRLEEYTRNEPLEWATFLVRRARALEQTRQGQDNEAARGELRALGDQAMRAGLSTSHLSSLVCLHQRPLR